MFCWCYLWQIQFCSLAPSACRSRLTPAAGRRIPSVPTKPVHHTCRSRITLPDRAFSEIRSMARFLLTHGWKKNCFWCLIQFMENCVRYTWLCCGSFSFSCIKRLTSFFCLVYYLPTKSSDNNQHNNNRNNRFPFFFKACHFEFDKVYFWEIWWETNKYVY